MMRRRGKSGAPEKATLEQRFLSHLVCLLFFCVIVGCAPMANSSTRDNGQHTQHSIAHDKTPTIRDTEISFI